MGLSVGFLPKEPAIQAPMKMSDYIIRGRRIVPETHSSFIGCAVGTAYLAKTGKFLSPLPWQSGVDLIAQVAKEFDMPPSVVTCASRLHVSGWSREKVASWLRSKGW